MGDVDKKHVGSIIGGTEEYDKKPQRVRSKEDAIKRLESLHAQLVQKRLACNVEVPGNPKMSAQVQNQRFQIYLMHIGMCLDAPARYFECGMIDEQTWRIFHQKALNTLQSQVVGNV